MVAVKACIVTALSIIIQASACASSTEIEPAPHGHGKRCRASSDSVIQVHTPAAKPTSNKKKRKTSRDNAAEPSDKPQSILKDPLKIKKTAGKKSVRWSNKFFARTFSNPIAKDTGEKWDYTKYVHFTKSGAPTTEREDVADHEYIIDQPTLRNHEASRLVDLQEKFPTSHETIDRRLLLVDHVRNRRLSSQKAAHLIDNWLKENKTTNAVYCASLSEIYAQEAEELEAEVTETDEDDPNLVGFFLEAATKYTKSAALYLGSLAPDQDKKKSDQPPDLKHYILLLEKANSNYLEGLETCDANVHELCDGFYGTMFSLLHTVHDDPDRDQNIEIYQQRIKRIATILKDVLSDGTYTEDHNPADCNFCDDLLHRKEVASELLMITRQQLTENKIK